MQNKALCSKYVNCNLSNSNDNYYYHYTDDQFFAYRALWRAVIMQAIFDLTSNSSRTEEKMAKKHAQSWLLGGSEDFLQVCSMAEYDPKFVKRKAISTITNYNKDPKKMRFFYTKLKKIYNTNQKNKDVPSEERKDWFDLEDHITNKDMKKGKGKKFTMQYGK